jgi:hypothetical protein
MAIGKTLTFIPAEVASTAKKATPLRFYEDFCLEVNGGRSPHHPTKTARKLEVVSDSQSGEFVLIESNPFIVQRPSER